MIIFQKKKKIAAGKAIEFFLSKEIQRKYMLDSVRGSALLDIYNDEELCSKFDCELYKAMQYVVRPTDIVDYENYSTEFRKNLNQFLYGGLSAKKALRNINYINSFDQILYNSLDGYIVEGISVLIITIIVLSYGLVFTNKFQFLTNTISKTLLSFQILGLCMTGSYVFFILGKLSKFKCLAGMVFFFMGISFIITPLLIMEIIYFPENNKLSEFAKKHSCILLFLILLIDFVVYGIALILQPVHIEKFRSSENMIFRSCIHNKGYYFIFYIMVFLFKGILLLLILILAFIEWNLLDIKREIKIVSYIVYTHILFGLLFIISRSFRPSDLYTNVFMRWLLSIMYTVIIYILIIVIKIHYHFHYTLKNNNNNSNSNNNVKIVKESELRKYNQSKSTLPESNKSYFSKILNYHNLSTSNSMSFDETGRNILHNFSSPNVILYTDIISTSQIDNE